MASDSNENAIADFDIDDVIDWDKHDIPSKDEFDQLHSLNVQAPDVVSSSPQGSSTVSLNSNSRDGLGLGSQLLAPPHREPTAGAMITMPQVPQSSSINPVFPGGPNSLICDIRQDYLHAQNLAVRSRTPPTPTFPSENFDLPPITPPGSIHASFAAGQQPLRMALISNLNRSSSIQSQLSSFVSPSLPPAVRNSSINQQLPPVVTESLVEGSNIDELIDEIVERNMPQGVSEPIVFTPHVSQQTNPAAAHLQMAPNALHKGISQATVSVTNPGHIAVTQTSGTGNSPLHMEVVMGGSPLNSPSSPGSPLTSSRSSSPNAKPTNLTGKVSSSLLAGNQTMRLAQPGSPLQSAAQTAVKNARSFPVKSTQGLNSQMLQMAVPSAVASISSAKGQVASSQLHPSTNVPAKHSMEAANTNPQSPRDTLTSSGVQPSVPQVQGQTIGSTPTKVSPPKHIQGNKAGTTSLQSSGKPIQAISIQTLASNPELLSQLVKAMGQHNVRTSGSATNVQGGQPLICYVVPQNSTSGVRSSQTISSSPLSSSSHPDNMILVNANSAVKRPTTINPQVVNLTNTVNTGLKCKPTISSTQLKETISGLETAVSQSVNQELKTPPNFSALTALSSGTMLRGNSSISLGKPTTAAGINNIQKPISTLSPVQQVVSRFLVDNSNTKQDASSAGPTTSNSVPLLHTPLSSSGNVVQITFVNEATAISHVVAAPPASTTLSSSALSSGGIQNIGGASLAPGVIPSSSSSTLLSSSQVLDTTTGPQAHPDQQDSDEDDDDSKPLSQVAENLKKVGGTDEVKKKKKKKKDKEKGTKRKRKGKDSEGLDMPLTAYELFFKETQAAVRTKNPLAQFEDIKKIVDQMWETLSENLKRTFQEKAWQQENQQRAKKLSQDEPSTKVTKVGLGDVAATVATAESFALASPIVIEDRNDAVAVAVNKPLSRTPAQVAIASKPVATVTPMAATKPNSDSVNQPSSIPAKPKKSKLIVNPISQRMCACDGCNKPARTTKERGTQYCSNECVVKHCRLAFTVWVTQRNMKEKAEASA
ncbi:uncharacterized protein [Montipora capricornis]|uniref:uncharacterized protein n=1 Tax=Montipora capricornis TaxID=246305 RepID=UPI0035F1AAE2